MMRRLILLAALVLSGCAHKLSQLPKATTHQSFVLPKDHARVETRGLGYKWVEGLRAGTYTLVAEDEDGLYFLGEGNSVLHMSGDAGEKYLKKGEVAIPTRGGLWLPKRGVEKDPKIWYEIHYGAQPSASGGGVIGAIGTASASAAEGDILFIGYGSEKDFLSRVKIVTK